MKILSLTTATLLLIAGGVVQSGAAADELPGKGVTIQPADQNYIEEWFQEELVSMGLEDLGYDVKESASMQLQSAILAVANGDATFYAAYNDPLHKAFYEKAGGKAILQPVGTIVGNSIQGYLIDKKTADTYKIKTINQFKDPAIAKLFDSDGDGKADLYGCDPGWGCERIINHQLDAYGLRDTVHQIQGSYEVIIADAIGRIKEGKPTIYYSWTPLWLSGVLRPEHEVEWLTVTSTALPEDQADSVTEVAGIGNIGFPVFTQHVLANTAFLEKNPAARKWFELLAVPLDDVNSENKLVHDGQNTRADVHKHAEQWKEQHKAQWDAWIAEAKAATKQ
ncbi:MAG: glycine betaine/L-proline ABC transporter substrate-binding protein ProX [Mesorhizobium sp.]|uniref:glycine betaine/L-proline ABC transporter substrate-binding protein ProX n=1 Tax=Mesorhizobium sp. TaxID=1871066 RepID=UPI0011F6EAFD|nr:glycine betaine/L-proline ABC transporter substrate-binding protein ProX [Mesorhizobium sp.]TIL85328.1 MAG: glycine betaine/L-proline ABC transporter substrate-binding protein ProX [Mesorhizobium sp.]TIR27318.1 MAG: glycine betaine/L-proline ABC transporter substrate-binding protein ProX [Mesorhizobium sp.]